MRVGIQTGSTVKTEGSSPVKQEAGLLGTKALAQIQENWRRTGTGPVYQPTSPTAEAIGDTVTTPRV